MRYWRGILDEGELEPHFPPRKKQSRDLRKERLQTITLPGIFFMSEAGCRCNYGGRS
jgi:hypothetical protein